jgi:hypothetical protein
LGSPLLGGEASGQDLGLASDDEEVGIQAMLLAASSYAMDCDAQDDAADQTNSIMVRPAALILTAVIEGWTRRSNHFTLHFVDMPHPLITSSDFALPTNNAPAKKVDIQIESTVCSSLLLIVIYTSSSCSEIAA